jgi:hypothetical protein
MRAQTYRTQRQSCNSAETNNNTGIGKTANNNNDVNRALWELLRLVVAAQTIAPQTCTVNSSNCQHNRLPDTVDGSQLQRPAVPALQDRA